MSIPLSINDFFEWHDTQDDVTYKFRYLTGDILPAFDKIQLSASGASSFLDKAEEQIERDNKGKKWKKGEREDAIQELARSMSGPKSASDIIQYSCNLIDMLLVGWDSKKHNLPPFPDSNPSAYMKRDLIDKLVGAIYNAIDELMGPTENDIKN